MKNFTGFLLTFNVFMVVVILLIAIHRNGQIPETEPAVDDTPEYFTKDYFYLKQRGADCEEVDYPVTLRRWETGFVCVHDGIVITSGFPGIRSEKADSIIGVVVYNIERRSRW